MNKTNRIGLKTTNKFDIRELTDPSIADVSSGLVPLHKLVEIARRAFGSEMGTDEVKSHVIGVDFLHIIKNGEDFIGFASYNTYRTHLGRILYLSGIAIDNSVQCKGAFYASVNNAINSIQPDYLVMRTQSKVVYHAASKINGVVYTSFETPPIEVVSVGSFIASALGSKRYKNRSFTETATYGMSLYGNPPQTSDTVTNMVFDRLLKVDSVRWRLCSYSNTVNWSKQTF